MSVKAITNLNLKHLVDELKANFFVNKDEKGVPGGVAALDANGKVRVDQIGLDYTIAMKTAEVSLSVGTNVINRATLGETYTPVFVNIDFFEGDNTVLCNYTETLSGDGVFGYNVTVTPDHPNVKAHVTYRIAEADANAASLVSEGFARGTQNGVEVASTSPYYHNNAKYYSEVAGDSESIAIVTQSNTYQEVRNYFDAGKTLIFSTNVNKKGEFIPCVRFDENNAIFYFVGSSNGTDFIMASVTSSGWNVDQGNLVPTSLCKTAPSAQNKVLTEADGGGELDEGFGWNIDASYEEQKLYMTPPAIGNGKIVYIVRKYNTYQVAYSTDGTTWFFSDLPVIPKTGGNAGAYWAIAYGNGKFIILGETYGASEVICLQSTDAITWEAINTPPSLAPRYLAYGKGKFVGIRQDNNTAVYSEDGITWAETNLPSASAWNGLYFCGDVFILISNNAVVAPRCAYSEDGVTWSGLDFYQRFWRSATYGDGKYIIVSGSDSRNGNSYYSEDGKSWTFGTYIPKYDWNSITYGDEKFIAVANNGVIGISTDCQHWIIKNLPSTISASGAKISYFNNKFIIMASGGEFYSVDALVADLPIYIQDNKAATMADVPTDSDREMWNGKQDALVFNTAYDPTTNKVATMADVEGGLPSTSALLKGDGSGGAVAAVAGTDYQTPLTAGTDYMAATDPTGTGSFSLNRKANTTVGLYSAAEGSDTTASGAASHAEGLQTTASGAASHAEGSGATASGNCSHAEGNSAIASGDNSHAEGNITVASGDNSHAEGKYTTASGNYQHVQGYYNVVDQAGSNAIYADIIGNGTASNDRKNIEATTWTGDKRLKGDVYVGCNDDSTGGTKLAKITDIPTTLASLSDDSTHRVVTDAQVSAWTAKADLASPSLTGTPTAPTASSGTSTTQIATTAFVQAEITAQITSALNASY